MWIAKELADFFLASDIRGIVRQQHVMVAMVGQCVKHGFETLAVFR